MTGMGNHCPLRSNQDMVSEAERRFPVGTCLMYSGGLQDVESDTGRSPGDRGEVFFIDSEGSLYIRWETMDTEVWVYGDEWNALRKC